MDPSQEQSGWLRLTDTVLVFKVGQTPSFAITDPLAPKIYHPLSGGYSVPEYIE